MGCSATGLSVLLHAFLSFGSQRVPALMGVMHLRASGQQYEPSSEIPCAGHGDLQDAPGFTQSLVSGQHTSPASQLLVSFAHVRFEGVRHFFASGQQYSEAWQTLAPFLHSFSTNTRPSIVQSASGSRRCKSFSIARTHSVPEVWHRHLRANHRQVGREERMAAAQQVGLGGVLGHM
eukprot:COSAG05_NODE_478_length_9434_cov_5.178897_3_plen_177_part_00